MDIEKIVNSKVFNFFDWLWKIFIINILTLITSLGLITIIPSFTACFQSIKDYKEGVNKGPFFLYFNNLKIHFKRTIGYGIIFALLSIFLIFILLYYIDYLNLMAEENYNGTWANIFTIGKYFIIFCLIIVFLIMNLLPIVYTYFYFRFLDNLRFSFYLCFKFLKITFAILMSWGLSFFIFMFTRPIWFFVGISLPWYLIYSFSRPILWRLTN